MICSLTNVSPVALLAVFVVEGTDGKVSYDKLLRPGEKRYYEDRFAIPDPDTWSFVEIGWFEDNDEPHIISRELHNWLVEGF